MSEKRVSVEWQLNKRNSDDNSWKFGYLNSSEIAILLGTRSIKFDGQTWNIGVMFDPEWDEGGLIRATIPLFEQG